jgi:hypothetical protein
MKIIFRIFRIFGLRNQSWSLLFGLFIISYLSLSQDLYTHLQRIIISNESNSTSSSHRNEQSLDNPPSLDLLYLVAIVGSPIETEPYIKLLIPFTLHALLSGPSVGVEIILSEDLFNSFSTSRNDILNRLEQQFGYKRLLLRTASPDIVNLAFERCKGHAANFVRFLERPSLQAKVTFIADADILILYPSDKIVSSCLRHMKALKLPYSNILRPTDKQGRPGSTNRHLTGLHTVLSAEYYDSSKWTQIMDWYNTKPEEASHPSDEALLQRMMKVAFGLPNEQSSVQGTVANQALDDELTWVDLYSWHLIWGIHLSPNRGIGKVQPVEASCKLCRMFEDVVRNGVYQTIAKEDKDVEDAVRRVRGLCKCCLVESLDSKVCKA